MADDRSAPLSLTNELQFALRLADVADQISLKYFRTSGLLIDSKPDRSPVTEADRAVEQALRDLIEAERPGHAILGEEYGGDDVGGYRWILDTIDGTRKYMRGIANFATLIALEKDNQPVLGVASAPAMGRRWYAARGLGAFADGQPIHVSDVARIEEAHILHGSVEQFVRTGSIDALVALATRCWGTAGFGDFWIHLLVAEGKAEAAVDSESAIWDVAALKIIVEEAGGRFTDMAGNDTAAGGTALSSNGRVHQDLLGVLRRQPDGR